MRQYTVTEIADETGYTRQHIHNLLKEILKVEKDFYRAGHIIIITESGRELLIALSVKRKHKSN